MKNVIIATAIALASSFSFATPMDSGNAEFTGTIEKVCSVSDFQVGTVVIREGKDGNIMDSRSSGGAPATFLVRANARNSVLTFGQPTIIVGRDDGVTQWYPQNREVSYSGKIRSLKNSREAKITNDQVYTNAVGTNKVVLHIRIKDTLRAGMLPAGTYNISVPVTCTKSTTAI